MTNMLFHSETRTSQGVAVSHFRLSRFHSSPDFSALQIWLDSWPDESARLEGLGSVAPWHFLAPVAGLDLSAGLLPAISAFLRGPDGLPACTEIADTVGSIDAARDRKWAEIKAERDARLAGTFAWGGHTFDVDPTNLTGAALDALLACQAGEAYAQAWVLADNSVIELDAPQQLEVGRACKAFIAGLWATSQQLRAQIDAAVTVEAVAAIVWPAS